MVSNGAIRPANKKFTSIPNDYYIDFYDSAKFVEVAEDNAISQEAWTFKPIKSLSTFQAGTTVDVIGIIIEAGTLGSIRTKRGEELERRKILIADETNFSVSVTLWTALSHLNVFVGAVIALKNCKVSDWQGCSLNSASENNMGAIDPKHQRTIQLKKWFAQRPLSEHNKIL